jgi:hypothetical protein
MQERRQHARVRKHARHNDALVRIVKGSKVFAQYTGPKPIQKCDQGFCLLPVWLARLQAANFMHKEGFVSEEACESRFPRGEDSRAKLLKQGPLSHHRPARTDTDRQNPE